MPVACVNFGSRLPSTMKRVVVLGSTGSIGTQTLDIIRQHPERLTVVGLAANRDGEALLAQASEWPEAQIGLMDEAAASRFGVAGGLNAICDIVVRDDVDIVVVSVAGVVGLVPTLAAIRAKKHVALASKEVLVAAGEFVMQEVEANGVAFTPIDSEHSAVFQCMQGYSASQVRKIYLTASGGPFRGWTRAKLADVTIEQALNHPTWRMGGKITIDSATLMNKALEMIEARWLFGIPMEKVDVVVHPQSIVHSFVEFLDGSQLAQCGWPNMRLPIQYALLYPQRVANEVEPWHPARTPNLTFEEVDHDAFWGPRLARRATEKGGTAACALNGANEAAVAAFLAGQCGFNQITEWVEEILEQHQPTATTYDSCVETDRWSRDQVQIRVSKAGKS